MASSSMTLQHVSRSSQETICSPHEHIAPKYLHDIMALYKFYYYYYYKIYYIIIIIIIKTIAHPRKSLAFAEFALSDRSVV